MEKVSILHHAAVLAEKHEISKQEAKKFIQALVEIIQEGIDNDKLVKIKGLGTFKIIGVESRESVDVNTGNRVVIGGHDKLTFTPDASMKELVNRPFSQFETVILNDGVNFEDEFNEEEVETSTVVEANSVENDVEAERTEIEPQEENENISDSDIKQAPRWDSATEPKEEPSAESAEDALADLSEDSAGQPDMVDNAQSELQKEQNFITEKKEETQMENQPDDSQPDDHEKASATEVNVAEVVSSNPKLIFEEGEHIGEKNHKNTYVFVFIIIGVAIFSLAAGYFIGQLIGAIPSKEEKPSVEMLIEPEDIPVEDTVSVAKENKVLTDSVKSIENINDTLSFSRQYEDKDSRVRTGAYYIVGTDQVIKARKGQTLGRISRSILGEGMECYMEVYNDMKASTVLEEGQEILIPKLVVKKKLKK